MEPALYLAGAVVDLLGDGARETHRVLRASPPPLSIPQYLALRRGMNRHETQEEA
ncbi:hypothetical protein F4561_002126 [Lipingzhangella halophila]|uniref:Uncharacterized protein n=1 Tax=Lipingzhangella halophila TaxID=1783352 RepID=A0A7W7W228_9ACTN|nr:hypothetical protein [Lipingzhangella halophila]MBB4931306.1 hypothetical protein [Lipingzhangella halophila]